MCTGLALETKDGLHLFGRNMDIEYSFNQSIIFIPRNFKCVNKSNKKINNKICCSWNGNYF